MCLCSSLCIACTAIHYCCVKLYIFQLLRPANTLYLIPRTALTIEGPPSLRFEVLQGFSCMHCAVDFCRLSDFLKFTHDLPSVTQSTWSKHRVSVYVRHANKLPIGMKMEYNLLCKQTR